MVRGVMHCGTHTGRKRGGEGVAGGKGTYTRGGGLARDWLLTGRVSVRGQRVREISPPWPVLPDHGAFCREDVDHKRKKKTQDKVNNWIFMQIWAWKINMDGFFEFFAMYTQLQKFIVQLQK